MVNHSNLVGLRESIGRLARLVQDNQSIFSRSFPIERQNPLGMVAGDDRLVGQLFSRVHGEPTPLDEVFRPRMASDAHWPARCSFPASETREERKATITAHIRVDKIAKMRICIRAIVWCFRQKCTGGLRNTSFVAFRRPKGRKTADR